MNDVDPESLDRQLAALPREIPPPRDLWPEVRARLDADPATASGRPRPAAAALFVWLPLAAALAVAALVWWPRGPAGQAGWQVAATAGAPRVGRVAISGSAALRVGQWLETDATSSARLQVGAIGEVRLEPNSRLRLVNAAATDHRLELARGSLSALIWAPPRLFFVETPAATAVDLGCAYTLSVDDDGHGVLEVTAGYVALDRGERESIVPAGMACRMERGRGPGTPYSVRATPELRLALKMFDAAPGDAAALAAVVAKATGESAITLWHLLARVPAVQRPAVFDRLASLQPPPDGVTREGILRGDRAMRAAWGRELGLYSYGLAAP